MLALQGTLPEVLARAVPGLELAEARKIVSVVHREGDLAQPIAHVRKSSLAAVRASCDQPVLKLMSRLPSRVDPFVKLALEAPDGAVIETVRIPLEKPGRFSVCVSSQVGCALACSFCATGRMGLVRNLATWEIVEQVRVVRRTLDASRGERVRGVVFQGMGEPLANLDRVIEAVRVMTDPNALAIDSRAVTVCTSGIPSGIRRLAQELPRVRLGLSIASARAEVRRSLMPVEVAHPLGEVIDACVDHARATGLAPMWAVTPLSGVNDTEADACALARLAADFTQRSGVRPRISLIPYNAIDADGADPFARSSERAEATYREVLRDAGFGTHKRYSGGTDVAAGCGQLATSARGHGATVRSA